MENTGIRATSLRFRRMTNFLFLMPSKKPASRRARPAVTSEFVVVTHQHPGHVSMLAELLAKSISLPVVEAADGMTVEPNRVCVGPPGGYLAILNGTLHRMETRKPAACQPRLNILAMAREGLQLELAAALRQVVAGNPAATREGVVNGEAGLISKAGRKWNASLTLLRLTDEKGDPEAVCMLARQPVT